MTLKRSLIFIVLPFFLGAGIRTAQAQVDAAAAMALAKRNDCFKCHAIDKKKVGPAYSRIASRMKSRPDAVDTIITHITSGPVIQLDDGTDMYHRVIDTTDPDQLKNIAQWILSL